MQGQTLIVKKTHSEFWLKLYFNDYWSEKTAKTRSTCQQNVHFHSSFQHVQGQTSVFPFSILQVFRTKAAFFRLQRQCVFVRIAAEGELLGF